MSMQSLYIHGIDSIEIRLAASAHAHSLILHRQSEPDPFEIYAFAPARAPTVRLQGIDAFALLDAAKAALRALNEAHEGNPVNLPLGVTEARACLLNVLSTKP